MDKAAKQLFTELRKKFDPKLIIVTGVPPMQHFPALPHPLAWIFGKHAQQMNKNYKAIYQLNQYLSLLNLILNIFKR